MSLVHDDVRMMDGRRSQCVLSILPLYNSTYNQDNYSLYRICRYLHVILSMYYISTVYSVIYIQMSISDDRHSWQYCSVYLLRQPKFK